MFFFTKIFFRAVLIAFFALVCFFPDPYRLGLQLQRFSHYDQLIDPQFTSVEEANGLLQALMKKEGRLDELEAVESFVYRQIVYHHDWDQWVNFDFWPDAETVWQTKREDCDGRAVLSASLLAHRGFEPKIVGNFQHIWVEVDGRSILGAQSVKTIHHDRQRLNLSVPPWQLIQKTVAHNLTIFPRMRLVLLSFITILVLGWPWRRRRLLFWSFALSLCFYGCLLVWAHHFGQSSFLFLTLLSGLLLSFTPAMFAHRHKTLPNNEHG